MSDPDDRIWELGFPRWSDVGGRLSVADLFPPKRRCGVYVLGFDNGDRYVGQSIDVTKRFAQHRLNHHDITHLTFRVVPKADLSRVERECIHALEARKTRLRNLDHMSVVQGERDLDVLISPEEQQRWLDRQLDPPIGPRQVEDRELRRRLRTRFERFMKRPHADEALFVLGTYIHSVIPFPRRTELTFWCMSCLPNDPPSVYSRVNINMQEVLTIEGDEDGLWVHFHLAQSPFRQSLGERWQEDLAGLGWTFNMHQWKPGGHDQFCMFGNTAEDATSLMARLQEPSDAMSLLNANSMRKGPTYWSRSHCFDLVDAAVEAFATRRHELISGDADRGIRSLCLEEHEASAADA